MHLRTLAFRRHQQSKKKAWAKRCLRINMHPKLTPASVGRTANTPTPCSCHMCGNPRKHFGNSHPHKISELRVIEAMQCEIDTINKSYFSALNI